MTSTTALGGSAPPRVSDSFRWMQLGIGVICMVMIANYQYGWTFFVPEIEKKFGWKASDIQVAFVLFVLFETWLVPIEGWFVDRYGPRTVIFFGGVLCGIGWWMTARATSLEGLFGYYASMIVCGIGAGAVYGTCIGNALKWFPDKRGLAAGITAAGFGAGSALTVAPIQNAIAGLPLLNFKFLGLPIFLDFGIKGFQETFLYFGVWQGIIICFTAFLMQTPRTGQVPAVTSNANVIQSRRQYAPTEIIGPTLYWMVASALTGFVGLIMWQMGRFFEFQLVLAAMIFLVGGSIVIARGQPIFVLMYFMFVIVGAGGLMVTANLKPIANTLKISNEPVTLIWTMTAITWAATIDRILNGLTRPFFGWISDNIGRENTMFVAFLLEGIGIYLLYKFGADPLWFVLLSGFVFFAWGEIYSLFPSTCTDTFGAKFAATNAGLLYTAKGTAALLTPFTNKIQEATGSWDTVFLIAAGANIVAALLALFVLKPWRARVVAASGAAFDDATMPAVRPRASGPVIPPPVLAAAGSVPSAIARPVATAGVLGAAAVAVMEPARAVTNTAAERLGNLRVRNRDLKQKLAAAIITHDSLQPVTAEALEAENATLEERLAWFAAENTKLGWK